MKISLQVFLHILLVFILGNCSTPTSKGVVHSSKETHLTHSKSESGLPSSMKKNSKREDKEYQEINFHFSESQYEAAQAKIASFSKKYPKSSFLPAIENLSGLILLKQKHPLQAIPHFRKSIGLNPNQPQFNSYVRYNLATAQFEAELWNDSQKTAEMISIESLDKPTQLKLFHLKANLYQKKLQHLDAARQILAAGQILTPSDPPEGRAALSRLLIEALEGIHQASILLSLHTEYKDSTFGDDLLMRLANLEISAGNLGAAESHLQELTTRFPNSPHSSKASELLTHPQIDLKVNSNAIGVLLPMKGKFGKYGTKSLQGIQLAFGIFVPSEPDTKIQLIVEDSGDDPEQAIKALNRLVFRHHVIAVIGPMLSKGIEQITHRAQELGVPLISLSRRAAGQFDYIFQAGLTQQLQTYEIARYAIQDLSLRRFAILYPDDKFGNEMSQNFWDAVQTLGGTIVGIESYHPGETDFRQSVDKLSGLFYLNARQRELDLLAQEREANHIKKRTRKTEQFFNLKPIVDYDAVFIPDDLKIAGQILPTFAYRDIENIKFLGTSAWNSSEFISRIQNYSENALFADAFLPNSTSSTMRGFLEKYRLTFGQEPTSLEAMAYDAGAILRDVLKSAGHPLSRQELRDELKQVKEFSGITGRIFFKDGHFFRNLKIIKIKDGRFEEAKF